MAFPAAAEYAWSPIEGNLTGAWGNIMKPDSLITYERPTVVDHGSIADHTFAVFGAPAAAAGKTGSGPSFRMDSLGEGSGLS